MSTWSGKFFQFLRDSGVEIIGGKCIYDGLIVEVESKDTGVLMSSILEFFKNEGILVFKSNLSHGDYLIEIENPDTGELYKIVFRQYCNVV